MYEYFFRKLELTKQTNKEAQNLKDYSFVNYKRGGGIPPLQVAIKTMVRLKGDQDRDKNKLEQRREQCFMVNVN